MKTRTCLRIFAFGIFAVAGLYGQTAPCTFSVAAGYAQNYILSPGVTSYPYTFVATPANCTWQASTSSSWITSISPLSGTGSGTVTVSFAANTTAAVRGGVVTLTSGSNTFGLIGTQNPTACQFTASPSSLSAPAAGGTVPLTIQSNLSVCEYFLIPQQSWLSISGSTLYTGTQTVSVVVTPNSGATQTGYVNTDGSLSDISVAVVQAGSSPATCSSAAASPIFVRAEGTAEQVADVTLTCTGGNGSPANISVSLSPSVVITSALLGSTGNFKSEILAGLNAGSGTFASGAVNGAVSGSSVAFTGVPTGIGNFTLTITNIRINASTLAVSSGAPPAVTETIFVSGAGVTPAALAATTVAYAESGLAGVKSTGATGIPVCNAITAASPSFNVQFGEGFSTAFKVRGSAGANSTLGSEFSNNTETGYGVTANGVANTANAGTRIKIIFNNIPSGVSLYVPTVVNNSSAGTLTLTASESGAFSAVAASGATGAPSGGAQLAATQGSATAIYEVTADAPSTIETYTIPVYLVAAANAVTPASAITATVSFAPIGGTLPIIIPSFANGSSTTTVNGSAFASCAAGTAQTITFGALNNVAYGAAPFTIAATASSGLPVTLTSTTSSVCFVSGATVFIVAPGMCSITATQAGNGTYAPATPVTQSFTVTVALTSQTITFDAIPNQILGASPFPAAAQASSLLPVGFASTTTAVCKTSDDLVILLTAGTCSIQAMQSGNANYGAATSVTRTFTVSRANVAGTLAAASGSPFSVGTGPFSVAVGDFNGDGIPDIVTANYNSNNVTVLLGNGSGGFTAASGSPFTVGTSPASVAVGDFNGDGYTDIATANYVGNNITVLLGNGAGAFTVASGSPFAAGTSPVSVVVGDFNEDGIQDLAAANFNGNNVTVLLGNGYGGFTAASAGPFAAGTGPRSLAVGDFNGDGYPDLAVANQTSSTITVLLGNGAGAFMAAAGGPFGAGSGPSGIVVGDFNADGMQDLAVASSAGNVTILLGNGLGGFTAATGSPFAAGAGSDSLVAGDFNGDGIQDLAVANYSANNVTVLLGNGSGAFAAAPGSPFSLGTNPDSVVAGDFNADGVLDLLAANYGANNVTLLLGGLTATTSVLSTSSPLTITLGQSVPLTLTVSDTTPAFSTLTGTATFSDSKTVLGTANQTTVLGTASQTGSPYTFTASGLAVGTHMLSASYGGGSGSAASTSNTIVILVNPAAAAPQTITFGPLNNVVLGVAPITISATASSGLAVTLTSNTASVCTVSGSAVTVIGAGTCSITASQAGNSNYSAATPVTQTFTVTATLAIVTATLPNGVLNQPYGPFTTMATGGTGNYSWSATGLPAGLTLSAAGVLSGAPTASGSFSVTLTVTSAGVTAKSTIGLMIAVTAPPLQIPGGGGANQVILTAGTVTTPYSQPLPASGGNPPYTWSVLGGALPAGLSLSSAGTLTGTPTLPGTAEFTGKVTDNSGASATSVFILSIAPQPLTIANGSALPNGIVGSDYPVQIFTATGGSAPYTFQQTGTLPTGLTFAAGVLSGNPTTSGTFNFTVTVTDSNKATASAPFQITIQPARTDLILSQTSLTFTLNPGATGLPAPVNIPVRSSVSSQLLYYSVSAIPSVSWLDLSAGTTTPGAIGISLDPSAVSLGVGVMKTSVVVTCISPSPCSGNSQTIAVTLNITSAPPQLSLTTNLLSFSAQTPNAQPVSQTLGLQNIGGGTITVNSVTAKDSFVTISGVPSTLTGGPAVAVTVTVTPGSLKAGYYQSTIVVNTSAGSINVAVTLLLAANPTMTLNPAGIQFQQAAGSSPGNPAGSFLVSVSGSSTVSWTAALLPGPTWLTLNTTSGTSTSAKPGSVNFSIVPSVAASLTAQSYYAVIQVTSSGVIDSPLTFLVILNVAPASSPAVPNPTPAGLLFIANGTATPAAQTVEVYTSSATPVTYQAASDSSWLTVSPSTGSTSTASPASSGVSVNLTGLAAGVYRGGVSYALSGAAVRTVNVTLIVEKALGSDRNSPVPLATTACVPAQLVLTQTGLVTNFSQLASYPAPLTVLLVDNCGNAVTSGTVSATFTNGDPQLALPATDTTTGMYSGLWTPVNPSQDVTIVATATAPGFALAATAQLLGQVPPNAGAPTLSAGGTVNAFTFSNPVAPGTIVAIFGSNLNAPGQMASATTFPLPTTLLQTSVRIGGMPAPLFFVSAGQINAQVPFELTGGQPYSVFVNFNGAVSNANPIQLTPDAPGIDQYPSGLIIAQHFKDYSLVSETSPAAPGEIVIFYLVGMGLANQTVPSGTASPSASPAIPLDTPTLTLNGVPVPAANILFAGLTPTLVGLYQIDLQVPANAPNGDLQLVLTQTTGLTSSTILPVHN